MAVVSAALFGGCGSTDERSNPVPPEVVIAIAEFLVDVGARFELTANPDEPDPDELGFFWTFLNASSFSDFDDRCDEDIEEICDSNDDDPCVDDPMVFCATNADCPMMGECNVNGGTTSSDCTSGICLLNFGNVQQRASFVADVPGPYTVRLTVDDSTARSTGTKLVSTHPSLYLVGSLFAFGGTAGGGLGEIADSATFAQGAVGGASNPDDGNPLLIVSSGGSGVVREFDLGTGTTLGSFGEVSSFVNDPMAIAFDENGRLHVADSDGAVSIFDGGLGGGATKGLFIAAFGDVTGGGESVSSMLFSPVTGNLLVVDGGAGAGIREYSPAGASLGVLGDTAGAVTQAVDAAFLSEFVCRHDTGIGCSLHADCEALEETSKCIPGDPASLLIADRAGDVVECDPDGTNCASFGTAAASLSANGPTSIATNPSGGATTAKVLIADEVSEEVIGCDETGSCSVFGDTSAVASDYNGVFFAPPMSPTTTTTTSTTTTTMP